jgi:hypothetical protein
MRVGGTPMTAIGVVNDRGSRPVGVISKIPRVEIHGVTIGEGRKLSQMETEGDIYARGT